VTLSVSAVVVGEISWSPLCLDPKAKVSRPRCGLPDCPDENDGRGILDVVFFGAPHSLLSDLDSAGPSSVSRC
jgi:hypothetical protein